ncbi:MAG: hypothetical protein IJ769_02370 [Clostridia bacterium]|nr:hypothetical protein [Clostridia bacterium]
MARYLTYEEYLSRGGTLGETDFGACELRARKRIDSLTYCRVRGMAETPEAVKTAMMSAIEAVFAYGVNALAAAPPLAAFTADGYSESYQSAQERSEAVDKALKREIEALLAGVTDDAGVPLTYAGVKCL